MSVPVLCTTYREELTSAPHNLASGATCPFCPSLVAYHLRAPAAPVPAAPVVPPLPLPLHSSSATSALLRFIPHLPKWSKESVCRPFLQRLHQLLSTSDIPSTQWPKVLVHVVSDVSASEWITKNILNNEMSWERRWMPLPIISNRRTIA